MRPLDTWNAVKRAAAQDEDLGTGLAKIALALWASHDAHTKVGHDQATREAFVASVVGAAVVDAQIEKLALDRSDKAFLLNLNAVAALEDLSQFTKSSGMLDFLAKHPAAVGAVIGGAGGAGFGAYADDENRLRGAVRFGVPGAIGGALVGHGVHQMKAENAEKELIKTRDAAKATRDEEAHALAKARAARDGQAHGTHQAHTQAQTTGQEAYTRREEELHQLELKRREAQVKQEQAKADDIKMRAEVWRTNNLKPPPPPPPPPPPAAPTAGSKLQSLQGALSTP